MAKGATIRRVSLQAHVLDVCLSATHAIGYLGTHETSRRRVSVELDIRDVARRTTVCGIRIPSPYVILLILKRTDILGRLASIGFRHELCTEYTKELKNLLQRTLEIHEHNVAFNFS